MSSQLGPRKNFFPHVEALERRWCPATTATLQGDTLRITGDALANEIEIIDEGDAGIRVFADGVPLTNGSTTPGGGGQTGSSSASNSSSSSSSHDGGDDIGGGGAAADVFAGVDRIIVRTLDGDDVVSYVSLDELTDDRDVLVDLGRGHDSVSFDLAAGVGTAVLDLNVKGSDGDDTVGGIFGTLTGGEVLFRTDLGRDNDTFDLSIEGDLLAGAEFRVSARSSIGDDVFNVSALAVNIDDQSLLDLTMRGDAGADEFTVDYQGEVQGDLLLRVDAGRDNDIVTANLMIDEGSEGFVAARVRGEDGDDDLTLNIDVADDLAFVAGLVDGGRGTDTCLVTDNVVTKKCEA